mgnify:CR=1 FL=1
MIVYDFTMNNTNNKQKEIGNESSNNEHMGACGHKDVRTGPDILFTNTLTLLNKTVGTIILRWSFNRDFFRKNQTRSFNRTAQLIETSEYRKLHDRFLVGTSIINCSSSKIIQGQECGAIDLSH